MLINGEGLADEPLLSATEETMLARRIEVGLLAREARESGTTSATTTELLALEAEGDQAWQRFVRANLRLVAMVTLPAAARSRLPEQDLFQEGCLGLMCALQRFDHRRPVRFATYALFWIRAYVGAATAKSLGELNLPTSRAAQLRLVRGLEVELTQTLGREATVAELAAQIGRTARWTADLMTQQPAQPLDTIDDEMLGAAQHGTDDLLGHDRPGAELLLWLDEQSRRVLELRLGFGGDVHSYAQVAQTLGLNISKVRRIERKAIDRLRAVCPQEASAHLRSA